MPNKVSETTWTSKACEFNTAPAAGVSLLYIVMCVYAHPHSEEHERLSFEPKVGMIFISLDIQQKLQRYESVKTNKETKDFTTIVFCGNHFYSYKF